MKKISFKTNDDAIAKTINNFISNCSSCFDLCIVDNDESMFEGEMLELVDGFVIKNAIIAEPGKRCVFRDAIARHIEESEYSKDVPSENKFSITNKSYWFLPYEAARTAKLVDCSLETFIDQMQLWFPEFIKDSHKTKKSARKMMAKFHDVLMVDWVSSPYVKYRRRKWAKSVGYYGLYPSFVKIQKTFKQ